MTMKNAIAIVFLALVCFEARAEDTTAQRAKAQKDMQNGNWKDAHGGFSALALNAADDRLKVGEDLRNAVICLQRLNRENECDDLFEKVVTAHKGNWHLLYEAAQTLEQNMQHYGYIVAGKFERGNHRGGGQYAQSF